MNTHEVVTLINPEGLGTEMLPEFTRLSFRAALPHNGVCDHCDQPPLNHIIENGIMYCAEWALRDAWGV